MIGVNWTWIGVQLVVPALAAGIVAYPIWLRAQPILGNLAGVTPIFAAAFALILRESVELDRIARACIDRGVVCPPSPGAFARYAIYAFIALLQAIALFSISLRVENRLRRRGYDPEWR